ncbi:hypothetical protein [Microbispora sp. CA-102843]|uniref:hypothetical protein n=1 Tax=Microbispora sp. CA-102843 TaxID=3239952 RepID=UPI003D8D5377
MADHIETAVRAVLGHTWGSGPWTAHSEHRYDAECAVCQGDVAAILALAAPLIAEHALRAATLQQHEEMVGRITAEAIGRERPKLLAMVEQLTDQAMAEKAGAIAAQARAEERSAVAEQLRAIPDDDQGFRTGVRRFIDRHDRLREGSSIVAVLLAAADEVETGGGRG